MQNVPQFIDIEDKVAGPLTWKQLGWLLGGGVLLFLLYSLLERIPFYIVAAPTILLVLAFAFYKPDGISLIAYMQYGLSFAFRPKVYTWRREPGMLPQRKPRDAEVDQRRAQKATIETDDVAALAQSLDSGGRERSARIQELIKQQSKKH